MTHEGESTAESLSHRSSSRTATEDPDLQSALMPDEVVLYRGIVHWGIYWKSGFLTGAGFLIALPALNLGLVLMFFGVLGLVLATLTRHYLMLVLTDRRVLIRYGVIQLEFVELRFSQIESVEVSRSIMARFLGYSAVVVMGTGQRIAMVPYIANGVQFRRTLNNILLKREARQ